MSDYIREATSSGVSDYGPVPQTIPSAPDNPVSDNSFIDNVAIAQVTGIDYKDMDKYQENLDTIRQWAQKQGYTNPTELKWVVRSLMDKLGSPSLTENWITTASRYAYLSLESDRINAERQALIK